MVNGTFHHFGVPTSARQPEEIYIAGGKVFVTDPEKHPYRVEYVRFEPDSPMPEIVKTNAHAAYIVKNLQEALKGKDVVIPPFDATELLRVAFVNDGGALLELMELRK